MAAGLASRKNPAGAFCVGCRSYRKQEPPVRTKNMPCSSVRVPIIPSNLILVPYYQATGSPCFSPPAREYPSRLRLHKRHDTDSRWRQVTKLPRPCPQYPPFTLRYGKMLVLLKLAAHGDPGAATRRSQALRVAARAFEVILFDGAGQAGKGKTASLPYPPRARRQSSRPCLGRLLYSPAQQEKLEYWL